MGDILAIISKAQFEAAHRDAKPGDALGFTQYLSAHAALEPVRGGGSIFLVTVRPPDERLWLVAELVDPKHDGKAWKSKPSTVLVKDITAAISALQFTNGKGLSPKKGALGMSLQTPRALTENDVALLRGGVKAKVKAAPPPAPVPASAPTPAPPAEKGNQTLGSVLEEWRATRAPELEKLIDTLSEHHARAWAPLDPEAADYDAAWNGRAADATPESLAHLLPGLWSDPRGSIPMRLRKLLDLGADPRLGKTLLKMIADPPLTASSNFSAWTLLFKALPSMVDARAARQLEARAAKKGGDSQFWPKLNGWIAAALGQLEAAAKLSQDQLASVAKRQKQAEALLARAPPAAVKAEKASAALPMKGSPRETLQQAAAQLSAGQPLEALEPLRLYWEITREPAVAGLMAQLGKAAAAGQPRFDEGTAGAAHVAWMKAGKRFDVRQVTPLLDALIYGKLVDAEERLELMLAWPADPRVAEVMMKVIDSSIGARPQLWRRVYDLLVRNADPRFREVLQKNATRLEAAPGFDRNRAERPHASRTIVGYVENASKGRKPSPDEAVLLEKLTATASASAAKAKAARKPDEELGLLQAIVAAPDDDTPKLVYADFLTERGDVRGEFINLSIALAGGAKVKAKVEALAKKHARTLAGPLRGWQKELRSGVVDSVELGFDDGELSEAELRELAEDLRWVTVRKLHMPSRGKSDAERLLKVAPLHGLQVLHDATCAQVSCAAARNFPWALHTIGLVDYALDAKTTGSAFPKLRQLELGMWASPTPAFWEAPLLQSVERLTMGGKQVYGEFPVDELIIHAPRLAKLSAVEVRTAAFDLDVVKAGPGRVDATFKVLNHSSFDDEHVVNLRERLRRIPPSAVRRFTLVEEGKARHRMMELMKDATRHLPSA